MSMFASLLASFFLVLSLTSRNSCLGSLVVFDSYLRDVRIVEFKLE
jgi:hypothetical protein